MKNNNILFILHLPPPVHGSSMVGQYIKDSSSINNIFNCNYINLGTSITVDEIGKNPLIKITRYLKILVSVLYSLLFKNIDVVYLAITAKGLGFYKDFPIALLAKIFGKKLVLHFHNKGIKNRQHKVIDNFLYNYLFVNTKVILLSKRLFSDIKKYVAPSDVFFCPNGIPKINYDVVDCFKNKTPQILFLSNLIESKGVYVLLNALKVLKDNKIAFHCNFVGGEGDVSEEMFHEIVSTLNISDNVTYLGKKYNEEKIQIFLKSGVFVLPTFYNNECFPLVLLEAMQFGLPIITTNEGGISDIVIDNKTGFLVEKQNSEQLAEKIELLIKNPREAKEMGEAGKKRFYENYTLEKFEERMVEILKEVHILN